jgi:hypothetical protein
MTLEEKEKRLADLRIAYKNARTDIDRKVITIRALLIKKTLPTMI